MNEVGKYKGPNSGGVSAFSIDRATGKLTFLNEVPSRGADPCYIIVDKTGKNVLVANYTGGSVAVFPVLADGKLGEASGFVQHTGKGPNAERQEGPHAHSIDLSPDNRFAMVDDLGLDELLVYKFDSAKGTLTPNDPPFTKLDAGIGPRHFVTRPDGKFAYVVSEIGHTVTVLSNDAAAGKLQPIQSITTLPKDFSGPQRRRRNSRFILRESFCMRRIADMTASLSMRSMQLRGHLRRSRTIRLWGKSRAASRSILPASICSRRIRSRTTSSYSASMRRPAT